MKNKNVQDHREEIEKEPTQQEQQQQQQKLHPGDIIDTLVVVDSEGHIRDLTQEPLDFFDGH
jgi:hypothetical protein